MLSFINSHPSCLGALVELLSELGTFYVIKTHPIDLMVGGFKRTGSDFIHISVFDDGDEKTLRRTSLCLKGERHFAESEVSLSPACFLHQCHQASQCSGGYLSSTDSGSAAAHQPRTLWDPSHWQKDQPWRPALLTGCVSVVIQTSRPTWTRRDPNCDFLFPHFPSVSLPPCLAQG